MKGVLSLSLLLMEGVLSLSLSLYAVDERASLSLSLSMLLMLGVLSLSAVDGGVLSLSLSLKDNEFKT